MAPPYHGTSLVSKDRDHAVHHVRDTAIIGPLAFHGLGSPFLLVFLVSGAARSSYMVTYFLVPEDMPVHV